jgi:hypothetical protein
MLIDWLHGDLHHWAIFCCTVASLGLIGAFWVALAAAGGKGVFAFLNGSRTPTVIVVNPGGQYVQQKERSRRNFGRYWLLFAAIFSGGPMLTLLIMGANAAAWYVVDWLGRNWWVFPVVGVLALMGVAFALLIRRSAADDREKRAQLAALPTYAPARVVAAEPAVGWTLDPSTPQWSERG